MDCTLKEVKSKNYNGSFKIHKLLKIAIHSEAKSQLTCNVPNLLQQQISTNVKNFVLVFS